MDLKLFLTVFATVFLAELGDKTQFATMLFSAENGGGRMTVFLAAAAALLVATALGVFAGALLSNWMDPKILRYVAGAGFIIIGVWTIVSAG